MKRYLNILVALILFLLLVAIKAFETQLFYDPLIEYFKNDYLYKHISEIHIGRLLVNMLFRYALNALISLGIIWVLFKEQEYVKFSGLFFVLIFFVLIFLFYFLVKNNFESGYLLPFYIRRFIIHPLFLLLLLPAFYYQSLEKS